MKKLNNIGETIIEVMLSIVILGFTITVVFLIARNALATGQAAGERTQALTIVESQIERLKYLARLPDSTGPDGIFGQGADEFCIDAPTNTVVRIVNITLSTDCDTSSFPVDAQITVSIVYDAAGPTSSPHDDNTFTISAEWFRVGGSDRPERIEKVYRLHPNVTISQPGFLSVGVTPPVTPPPPNPCQPEPSRVELTAYARNIDELSVFQKRNIVDVLYNESLGNIGRDAAYPPPTRGRPFSHPDILLQPGFFLRGGCDYRVDWQVYCALVMAPFGAEPSSGGCGEPGNDSPAEAVRIDMYGDNWRGDRTNAQCTGNGAPRVASFTTTDESIDNTTTSWRGTSEVVFNIFIPAGDSIEIRCIELVHICIPFPDQCNVPGLDSNHSIHIHELQWIGIEN